MILAEISYNRGKTRVFAAYTPLDTSDFCMLLTTDTNSGADTPHLNTGVDSIRSPALPLRQTTSAVRSRHGRTGSRSGSHNVGSAGQLLVQPQRIRRGVAEQGQVALEVGVRSLVDDDLPADELLAVEDLAEDDVARAQQDGAVGGDEQPG